MQLLITPRYAPPSALSQRCFLQVQQQQQEAGVLEAILEVLKKPAPESVLAKVRLPHDEDVCLLSWCVASQAMYALSAITGNHEANIQALLSPSTLYVLEQLMQPGSAYMQSLRLQLKVIVTHLTSLADFKL